MSTVTAQHGPGQDAMTIRIEGIFDASDRTAFEGAYSRAAPGTRFVVDLENAEDMTADSLSALLGLRHHAGGASANVDIVKPNGRVRTMLELMNFDQLFEIS